MIVKLFIHFRPLRLRYLQPTTHLAQISEFWRYLQSSGNQPFEFYWHELGLENEPERAQMGLQKGHSCSATMALSAFNCGSFASSKSPNGIIEGVYRQFKVGFPFWLESFGGCVFVDIIRYFSTSCGVDFHRSLSACSQCVYASPSSNIYCPKGKLQPASQLSDKKPS